MQRLSVTILRPLLSILLSQLGIITSTSPEATCSGISLNYMFLASGHYVPEIVVTVIGFEYPRLSSLLMWVRY